MTYPDTDQDGALELIEYLLSENARSVMGLGAWTPSGE